MSRATERPRGGTQPAHDWHIGGKGISRRVCGAQRAAGSPHGDLGCREALARLGVRGEGEGRGLAPWGITGLSLLGPGILLLIKP